MKIKWLKYNTKKIKTKMTKKKKKTKVNDGTKRGCRVQYVIYRKKGKRKKEKEIKFNKYWL